MGDPMTTCSACGGRGKSYGNIGCGHCGGSGLVVDPIRKLLQDSMDRNARRSSRVSFGGSAKALPTALRVPALVLGGLAAFLTYGAYKPDPFAWIAAIIAFAATMFSIKLAHSVVTHPFQSLLLFGMLFGLDQYLFAGNGLQWLTSDGLNAVQEYFK
jgi:hypothetical protein